MTSARAQHPAMALGEPRGQGSLSPLRLVAPDSSSKGLTLATGANQGVSVQWSCPVLR